MISIDDKPDMGQEQETISVQEFAEEMGWDPSTVTRAINAGRIRTAEQRKAGMRRIPVHRILKSEITRLRNEAAAKRAAQSPQ